MNKYTFFVSENNLLEQNIFSSYTKHIRHYIFSPEPYFKAQNINFVSHYAFC